MLSSSLLLLLCVFSSLTFFFCSSPFEFVHSISTSAYDVCVLGGGSSGSSSAVFLKQLGYSVKVIERNNSLGGHCNTVDFSAFGQNLWVDIGVQVYVNTSWARQSGFGDWALSSDEFVAQFVPQQLIVPVVAGSGPQNFNADFLHSQLLDDKSFNQTQFGIAFNKLLQIGSQFPWINNGERPDPIPAFMLEPFIDFINKNNLQILIDPVFNPILFSAGVGSLYQMSTLEALPFISPSILLLLAGGPSTAGFTFLGGCHVLYEGIAAYLGDAVTYNASIRSVQRHRHNAENPHPTLIHGRHENANGDEEEFSYSCGKTVVAFYPLLQNLNPWFELTPVERDLFSELEAHGYLALATTFEDGPAIAGQPFGITNLDPSQPFNLPLLPNLSSFQRFLPFGPAAAWVNSQSSLTPAKEMLDVAWKQFKGVPSSLISNITISAWSLHQYSPHWKISAQRRSPSPDTIINNLQGTRGTYWVGSAFALESSAAVWNQAFKLIKANFPPKAV